MDFFCREFEWILRKWSLPHVEGWRWLGVKSGHFLNFVQLPLARCQAWALPQFCAALRHIEVEGPALEANGGQKIGECFQLPQRLVRSGERGGFLRLHSIEKMLHLSVGQAVMGVDD